MASRRGFDPKAQAGKVPEPEQKVELLVIGAGASGVAAATAAAQAGVQVLLVDEHPVSAGLMGLDTPFYFGGRYNGSVQSRSRMMTQMFAARPKLEAAYEAGVQIELGVACWGAWVPGPGLASLPCPLVGLADEERAWTVGFERLIVATGARDVTFAFKGWDQPGVMGARGLGTLMGLYDAFAGRRLAILGSGQLAFGCARMALDRGLEVAGVIEAKGTIHAEPVPGVDVLTGCIPLEARGGREGVEGLRLRDLARGTERDFACDTIVQAVSLTPVIDLLDVLGVRLAMQSHLGGHAPVSADGTRTNLSQVFVAGEVAGVPGGDPIGLTEAEDSGRRAAVAALQSLGRGTADASVPQPNIGRDALAYHWAWADALLAQGGEDVVVCQCEDVTRAALLAVRPPAYLGPPSTAQSARDLARLLEDGAPNQDQIKRLTRAGMGPCQGRRCREQIAFALARASSAPPESIPLAGYRAPVRPLPLKVLADWDETAVMGRHWDVWMGIAGQWAPYEDVGTDRETLNDDLLGADPHL